MSDSDLWTNADSDFGSSRLISDFDRRLGLDSFGRRFPLF